MQAQELIRKCWPEWELGDKLGQGSFGEVYEIRDPANPEGGTYAVKIIRYPQREGNEGLEEYGLSTREDIEEYYRPVMQNLINEIRIMERLRTSGNIVVLYEYKIIEEHDPFCWNIALRMEKLESLTDYKRRHTLTEKEILDLGIDISKAIAICHESNIIHRDIKESNIFRSPHGSYKIGDFGISKHIENTQASLSHKGTLNYMAPEIYRGEPYGYNVDTYSLGLVLYRLLNRGRIPFLPNEGKLNARQVEDANGRRLSGETLPPPVDGSPGLIAIIEKACNPNPRERYQSAEEMKEALIRQRYTQETPETTYDDEPTEIDERTEIDVGTDTATEVIFPDRQTPPPLEPRRSMEKTEADDESIWAQTSQDRGDRSQEKRQTTSRQNADRETTAPSQEDPVPKWSDQWNNRRNTHLPTEKPKKKGKIIAIIAALLCVVLAGIFLIQRQSEAKLLARIDEIKNDRDVFELRAGEGEDYQIQYYSHADGKEITRKGKYLGEMKSGKPNGLGVFAYIVSKTGSNHLWIGEWKDGVFEGKGEERIYDPKWAKENAKSYLGDSMVAERQKTKLYFLGMFKNFELNGQGEICYADGSPCYEGEFKDDQLNGRGKIYYVSGILTEEGEYKNGELNGRGKRYYNNGQLWQEGEFKDGELNGQGKKYLKGQLLEEGEYKGGKLNGQGKTYRVDGELMEEGEFRDGFLYNGTCYTDYGTSTYKYGKIQ